MTGPDTRAGRTRLLVLGGAALALFLLGAAAGVLIGIPGAPKTDAPAAGSVDVGFAQDMSVHHEQAVEMASWERDHTSDPRLRQLAFDIETGQSRQIGHMQGWLALWDAAPLPSGQHMVWMRGGAGHDGMAGMTAASAGSDRMPGMATPEELKRLRASSGAELDVLFLQLMLRHHAGGGPMLAYAAQYAAVPDVRTTAGKMLTAQNTESDYMRELLAERGGAPLPS